MNSSFSPVRVAIIGCGAISKIYFENMKSKYTILSLVACCDLNTALAAAAAEKYDIKAMTLEEIKADTSIELVVNLTTPAAHYSVIESLLQSGKHVYTEKVLCTSCEDAARLLKLSDEKGLMLCAAPDTFLGSAAQTARFAVDAGLIGTVTSCVATLQRDAGLLAERFPYTAKQGGGIGVDVGIYYATELLSILGPVKTVCGMAQTYQPNRTHCFTSRETFMQPYEMTAETLLAGTMQFESGAIGTLHFNSASIRCEKPSVVLYGTQGVLYLPDPNFFGGDVKIMAKGQTEPYIFPPTHAYSKDERGLGVAEMAWSLRRNRTPRANKKMAYHALEVLMGMIESGNTAHFYEMQSTFVKTPPLPRGYMDTDYGMSEPEAALAFDA